MLQFYSCIRLKKYIAFNNKNIARKANKKIAKYWKKKTFKDIFKTIFKYTLIDTKNFKNIIIYDIKIWNKML